MHAGGLTSGYYALAAALRYERFWLPMLVAGQTDPKYMYRKPPLDVAYAW